MGAAFGSLVGSAGRQNKDEACMACLVIAYLFTSQVTCHISTCRGAADLSDNTGTPSRTVGDMPREQSTEHHANRHRRSLLPAGCWAAAHLAHCAAPDESWPAT